MFLAVFFVTLWNDEVCDNGNAMMQCNIVKTIMVSLHRVRFLVVHLYSTFSVDPLNFPLRANLYQKIPFFTILGALSPYFLKPQR